MAGRNIGSVEVTVDANTGKLRAQLVKEGKVIGEAMGHEIEEGLSSVDGRELLAKLRKIRAQAERAIAGVEIDVGVDDAKARADLKKLEGQLRATQLELKINPDFDDDQLQSELEFARILLRDMTANVDVKIDRQDVEAVKEEIRLLLGGIDAEIGAKLDEGEVLSTRARLQQIFADAGEDSGGSFVDNFSGRLKLIIGAVAALAEPAATVLTGALGAAVQLLGSAFQGMVGGAGAAVPVILTLGGAVTALIVGSQGVGDAFKAMNKEFSASVAEGREFNIQAEGIQKVLANLAPEAQQFALALADTLPILRDIREQVQNELFIGLDDKLRELSDTLLPRVGDALTVTADSLNDFFKGLSDIGVDLELDEMFLAMKPALDDLLDSVLSIIDAIGPFFSAATPAAKVLAQSIADSADSFNSMVKAGARSGELTDFLVKGVESLQEWFGLLKNVGESLITLFDIGAAGGDSMVRSLSDIVGRFNDWMKTAAGTTAVEKFFDTTREIMSDLVPVLEGLTDLFAGLVTPDSIERFGGLAEAVGELGPLLAEVLGLIGRADIVSTFVQAIVILGKALEPLMPAFEFIADLIGALPAPLVAGAFAIYGMVTAFLALEAGIKTIAVELMALTDINPVLLGLSVAIGVVVAAIGFFSSTNAEANARIQEVSSSLDSQINALLEDADAANSAALGVEALSRALADSGEAGKKLTNALGVIHASVDDTVDIFTKLSKDPVKALEDLAKGAGLSAEQAKILGLAVDATDDDFDKFGKTLKQLLDSGAMSDQPATAKLIRQLRDLGVTGDDITPEMIAVGAALEEIQDQSDINLDKTVKEFLNTTAASTDLNETLLEQAETNTNLKRTGDELVPLYEEFTRLLALNKVEGDAAAQTQAELDRQIKAASDAAEQAAAPLELMTEELSAAEQAATNAGKAADALTASFKLLVDPMLTQQESWDGLQEAIAATNEQILGAVTKQDGFTTSLTDNSEAARDNREAIREQVNGILEFAGAQVAAGEDVNFVATQVSMLRQQLIDQLTQFGLTQEAATAYVDALGLTPENITTAVNTPGLEDALAGTDTYKANVDEIKDEVTTQFKQSEINTAQLRSDDYRATLDETPEKVTTDFEHVGLESAKTNADDYSTTLDETPTDVTTAIHQTGMVAAMADATDYSTVLGDIPSSVSTTFSLFHGPASTALSQLKSQLDALDGRIVSTTVRISAPTIHALGGRVGPAGGIGGEAGPEMVRFNGHNTLIDSPTVLPPGAMVTPLTGLNAMPVGKQINLYQTIISPSADPLAVATQVVNRAVVLAQQS